MCVGFILSCTPLSSSDTDTYKAEDEKEEFHPQRKLCML